MSVSIRKIPYLPGVMALGFTVLAVPVVSAIVYAIWLAGAAAFENVKFAHCTDQVLALIAQAQDDAVKDRNFGQTPNEDIIDDLIRRGQIQSQPRNAWSGDVRAVIQAAQPVPLMHFETDLPSYACKRLAIYLGKNAGDIKLQKMAAREENGTWNTFFDMAVDPDTSEFPGVNEACGKAPYSTLALTIKLR